MALKISVVENGCFWVELQGTDIELNNAKQWVRENMDTDRARPYKHNRTIRSSEFRDYRNPNQILATTIPFFYKKDVMLFKLAWG
jgi:hypothetical protein